MRMFRVVTLFALAVLTSACPRGIVDADASALEVRGEWLLVQPADGHAHTEERLTLGADGGFRSELLWLGFYDLPADEVTGWLRTRGGYRVEGGRLFLRIERMEEWQKYAVDPNPSAQIFAPAWTERGTVRVEGDRLIHTFVAAPLDAPETFTLVYQRVR